jgi:hypothetical protein
MVPPSYVCTIMSIQMSTVTEREELGVRRTKLVRSFLAIAALSRWGNN